MPANETGDVDKGSNEHKEEWRDLGLIFIVEFIKTTKTLLSIPGSTKILGML